MQQPLESAVIVTGLLVFLVGGLAVHVRSSPRRVDETMARLARETAAPWTPEVEAWLRPQLSQRDLWIGGGATVGAAVATTIAIVGELFGSWYLLLFAVGSATGGMVGTLVSGFGAFPRIDSSRRTASVQPRRLADYLRRSDVVSLRFAPALSVAAAALSVAFIAVSPGPQGVRASLLCSVSAAIVVAAMVLARLLVRRPIVSSAPEGRLWQEALLAHTLQDLPLQALVIAAVSSVCVGIAIFDDIRSSHWFLLLAAGALCLASLAAVAVAAIAYCREAFAPKAVPVTGQPRW